MLQICCIDNTNSPILRYRSRFFLLSGGVCVRYFLLTIANFEKIKCQIEKTTLFFQEKSNKYKQQITNNNNLVKRIQLSMPCKPNLKGGKGENTVKNVKIIIISLLGYIDKYLCIRQNIDR